MLNMKFKKTTISQLLLASLCSTPLLANAEAETETAVAAPTAAASNELVANELYLTPVPVLGYNPANGTIYGVGASASYYFGEPEKTKVSNMLVGVAKTSLGQTIALFKSTAFSDNNGWAFLGDWRYLDSSQPTYGLGTGPQSSKLVTSGQDIEYDDNIYSGTLDEEQMMEYQYTRFYETVLKRITGDWYLGLGYHLDYYQNIEDNLLDVANGVITSHYAYSIEHGFDPTESTLSGTSVNAMLDSRDSSINPSEGQYALASYRYNAEFLGSDQDSSTLWLEYRKFLNLTPGKVYPDVLAFWTFGNFVTSGDVPYLDLPATGYDQYARSGAGYVQGRFRGQDFAYLGLEYRKHLGSMWSVPVGGVVFGNATTASATGHNDISLGEHIEPGYGAGLRFMLQKKTNTNLGIDFAVGNYQSSALYVRLNENF
ncbi:MAG: hypothetical protein JKY50_13220 [Oleispira sp.]|nr:hypothetical protein [Oleispira sp.]MBL4880370.1 hypothetical protein [Oleispira sp.]